MQRLIQAPRGSPRAGHSEKLIEGQKRIGYEDSVQTIAQAFKLGPGTSGFGQFRAFCPRIWVESQIQFCMP
ncbi:hypothetical protein CJU94_34875 (plasmid) [Paraburkholderia aromaticivorans]|uniref:Uncharacterized protein n=1 Tax=Paraburkholderia aromaticivorans TaxID=2026199 RepID=A0A248VXW3_9BURK|nr:hypothetical protein CJU94_34875 [Paraburkholderia aromaticivorans]